MIKRTIPDELAESDPAKIAAANRRLAEERFAKYAAKALAKEESGIFGKPKGTSKNEITDILKDFQDSSIDAETLDVLLTSEVNRNLKKKFAWVFAWFALISILLSYSLVALNKPLSLGISEIAMTALIIEAPIQFIGILYIVANNLFPSEQ